jgi:hypothetical protein
MEVGTRMQIITSGELTKEFEVQTIKCRKLGNQNTFYVPTINASNFFGKGLEVFPMRYRDEEEQLGLAFFLDMPKEYFYKPYKVYKLKRPYKLADGSKKMTYSFYVPIPSQMIVDLGIGKGMPKLISMKGGYMRDGQKVILIQKRRGPTN